MSALQEILDKMYVDPEILEQLTDEQKQILFIKMRDEQLRKWKVFDEAEHQNNSEGLHQMKSAKRQPKVRWLLGDDGEVWTWVMGEHKDDLTIEEILENEAKEVARQLAEQQLLEASQHEEGERLVSMDNEGQMDQDQSSSPAFVAIRDETMPVFTAQRLSLAENGCYEKSESPQEVGEGPQDNSSLDNNNQKNDSASGIELEAIAKDLVDFAASTGQVSKIAANSIERKMSPEKSNNKNGQSKNQKSPSKNSASYKFSNNEFHTSKEREQNGGQGSPKKERSATGIRSNPAFAFFNNSIVAKAFNKGSGTKNKKDIGKEKEPPPNEMNLTKRGDGSSNSSSPSSFISSSSSAPTASSNNNSPSFESGMNKKSEDKKLSSLDEQSAENSNNLYDNLSNRWATSSYSTEQRQIEKDLTSPIDNNLVGPTVDEEHQDKLPGDQKPPNQQLQQQKGIVTSPISRPTQRPPLPPKPAREQLPPPPLPPTLPPELGGRPRQSIPVAPASLSEEAIEKRQSLIFEQIQAQRKRLDEEAESDAEKQNEAWLAQERRAKAADDAIRLMAQRARQAHQKNLFRTSEALLPLLQERSHRRGEHQQHRNNNRQQSHQQSGSARADGVILFDSPSPNAPSPSSLRDAVRKLQKPPKPPNREAIIEWFKQNELQMFKRTGLLLSPFRRGDPPKLAVDWFHGVISRPMAEELLYEKPPGAFLVRVSERIYGYTVSVVVSSPDGLGFKHFIVERCTDGNYQFLGLNQMVHGSLRELVEHHEDNPITNRGGELLTFPVGQLNRHSGNGDADYADLLR